MAFTIEDDRSVAPLFEVSSKTLVYIDMYNFGPMK